MKRVIVGLILFLKGKIRRSQRRIEAPPHHYALNAILWPGRSQRRIEALFAIQFDVPIQFDD